MKMDKLMALCLAGLLFIGGAGAGYAQGGAGDAGSGGQEDPLALYKAAGINAEQEGEIRKLAKEFEDAQRVRLKTLIGLMRDLKTMQLQADPPETQVIAKQEEINKMSGEMATERVRLLLKVRKVLTPDQRQKLVTLLNEASQQAPQGAPAGQ